MDNPAARADAELAVREYLRFVIQTCAHLTRIPGGRTDREPPELADVYVPLNVNLRLPETLTLADYVTQARDPQRQKDIHHPFEQAVTLRAVSALEVLDYHQTLTLVGKPGSGKSTFTAWVALLLARAGLGDASAWTELGHPWSHGPLLPVRVVVRRLAEFLAQRDDPAGTAALLWEYLAMQFERDGLLPNTAAVLQNTAHQAGALFLLDGLDEAPAYREEILAAVAAFQKTAGEHSRYVITARPYALPHARQAADGEYALDDLSPEQVGQYVVRWCRAMVRRHWLTAAEAGTVQLDLEQAVQRPDLRSIVTVPLLLHMTAAVRTAGGRFPDDRVDLYDHLVTLMLETWNRASDSDRALLDALQIPGLTLGQLRGVLQRVAFDAHAAHLGRSGTADVDEHTLQRAFRRVLNDSDDKGKRVIAYIEQRAGLLFGLGSPGPDAPRTYTFPHRTFQEYLAACHLAERTDFEAQARALADGARDSWREVLVMAGRAAGAARGTMAAYRLVGLSGPDPAARRRALVPADWERAALAAEMLLEIGLQGIRLDEATTPVVEALTEWLLRAMTESTVPPRDRARYGDILGRLGDPRDLEVLETVPAGWFWMGSDRAVDSEAYPGEAPQHEIYVDEFRIGRFPVTVEQWRTFVTASGYFGHKSALEGNTNQPVASVSWHDACAYCDWLNTEWSKHGKIGPQDQVRLPTEAEWEKAVRGIDRRVRAWGPEADPNMANYDESGIDQPSAVGCFPAGCSPYGVEDMLGNVWEWTYSLNKPYPYDQADGREVRAARGWRVVRGGSYSNARGGARCAYRNGYLPEFRNDSLGFRVVVVSHGHRG